MSSSGPRAELDAHVRRFFAGHDVDTQTWPVGPIEARVPGFRVLRVHPGPRTALWTYVTAGCWFATQGHPGNDAGHGVEFILVADAPSDRQTELLTTVAYYHAGPPGYRLDLGHTVPIGEGWVPGSALTHFLVSLPYPFGPDLERCAWDGGHARLLWLLPITEAERDFKAAHGVEVLEQRFDAAAIEHWDPHRPSVV